MTMTSRGRERGHLQRDALGSRGWGCRGVQESPRATHTVTFSLYPPISFSGTLVTRALLLGRIVDERAACGGVERSQVASAVRQAQSQMGRIGTDQHGPESNNQHIA